MAAELAYCASCRARYETPGRNDQTRAERNEAFQQPVPVWEIPEEGLYLWNWFFEISDGVNRVVQGQVIRLSWVDIRAWIELSENIVHPREIAILKSMDMAYCEALEGELGYARAITQEEAEAKRTATLGPKRGR